MTVRAPSLDFAVLHQLLGDLDLSGGEVDVLPGDPAGLPAAHPGVRDEGERGVKPVRIPAVPVLDGGEEPGGVFGGPDHDRVRYLPGLAPAFDAFGGPQLRLRARDTGQVDVLGDVLVGQLLLNRVGQGGAQARVVAGDGRRALHRPQRREFLE